LIFLPDADLNREMELFAEAAFFKGGNHENGMANARDHKAHEPFAKPPANPREVVKRSARGKEKRVVFCRLRGRAARRRRRVGHKALRVLNALAKFIGSDGMNAVGERLERGKGGRE
jgi:hypothetical protein